ncbi:MAG: HlyD family efflux transporter periplasmic adaptor subunit [Magnetococcales bacterium]|nr:HlyD family efflux transporter periplasmic adaptor subunit [Magnetococcales bacterium]
MHDPSDDIPQHRSSRIIIFSIFVVVVGFLVWAQWAEIDKITRTTGQIIASARNQVIQAQDTGVIEELAVREGDRVNRGQLLVRFDKTKIEAGYQETLAKSLALRGSIARLKAEIFDQEIQFPEAVQKSPEIIANQSALYRRRRTALREEIGALESALKLVRAELELNLPLQKTGDVSKADIIRLQRQEVDLQSQIVNRRNKYFQDLQAELTKAQEDLAGVEQILVQRKDQLDNTELKAPMSGVVRNIRITTQGGVARSGEEIMQIVPQDDDLLIEAKVKPSDIAFVKPGLPVTVKLDAYDYTIYGSLHGTVSYISADTLNEEVKSNEPPQYRVRIVIKDRLFHGKKNAEPVDIQTGMTATVEIKTGVNTVLHYLAKPIVKTLSESIGER